MTVPGADTDRPRLNPEQESVVGHTDGPIRVMAGAGTGKTHTLTSRVLRLIADGLARPDQILALTFGNKAADDMREQITKACLAQGIPPEAEPVTVLTYHSFGNSVVAEWGALIGLPPSPPLLSKAERWLLLWDCLPRIDFRFIDLMNLRGNYGSPLPDILQLGSRLKDELTDPEQLMSYLEAGGVDDHAYRDKLSDYARALSVYEEERARRGMIDFGDQIALAVRALQLSEVRDAYRERFRYVLVDEYQDTNYAQSVMVQLLVKDWTHQNVCVVGDIRQAIYRFRGAAPDNLVRFPDDYADTKPHGLRRNYRSTVEILDAANAVWTNGSRAADEQDLISVNERRGAPVVSCACEDEESEWEWVARQIIAERKAGVEYREMVVLVRKNEMKRQLWRALLNRGIPAVMSGGIDLLRTPEVREILSYLTALSRPSDNVALAHIAASDSFGLDEAALYDLIGPLPRGRSLFDVLIERSSDPGAPNGLRLFLAAFAQLLTDAATLSPARIVERVIGLRRGAHNDVQRANVYRFQAMAEDFVSDRVRGATVGGFVTHLNLLLAAPPDEEEAIDLSEDDAVQVMTAHSAKGLERSVVFVATASEQDFTLPYRADTLPAGLRHTAAGMPRAEDFSEERQYKKSLEAWEREEQRLEEQRVAYVTLTRAKDRLYISWHRLPLYIGRERRPLSFLQNVLPLTDRQTFNRSDWDDILTVSVTDPLEAARDFIRGQANLWADWSPEDFDQTDTAVAECLAEAWRDYVAAGNGLSVDADVLKGSMQQWRSQRGRVEGLLSQCLTPSPRPLDADVRTIVDVPTTLSYSILATYESCSRKAYLRFLAGFPGDPSPDATGAGTAFHAAVELNAAIRQAGRESTFDDLVDAYSEAAAEALGTARHSITVDERAMLQSFWDSPDREAIPLHVEAEFYWRVGPGYLHGFIDRIQRRQDGTIELIDFKTSRRPLSEAEAKESLQLLIYALASREVFGVSPECFTLVYPRLATRVSVSFSDEELAAARRRIVQLMERTRTASYDEFNTSHCQICEYRLICPAASTLPDAPTAR